MEEFQIGSRTLQPHRQLLADGERVPIGKRALDIISVLAEAEGEIVTKDELLEAVWPGITVEENALQVHVVALRKALGPEADRLETIRGVGYRLDLNGDTAAEEAGGQIGAGATTSRDPTDPVSVSLPEPSLWNLVPRTRSLPYAILVAVIIGGLFATWSLLGDSLRTGERPIPVLVRALNASATGDPTEVTLASGVTDELIVRLRRIPQLQVGTARLDGSAPSAAFKKAYVVDGNIRSEGDALRVTARLTDAEGAILWSQTFDGQMADIFEVQERIASSIAGALSVPLDVGPNAVVNGGTTNPEAYAAFVRALGHTLDFDQSTYVRLLQEAIKLDPGFVRAQVHLASSYGNRLPLARTKDEADRMLAEMDQASRAALRVNPDIALSNVTRAWYHVTRKDLPSAERLMTRAAELDGGNDPQLRVALAQYAVTTGRNRKALSLTESQALIDPIYEQAPQKIFMLMMNGRYQESADLYDRLAADEQQNLQAQIYHAFWAKVLAGEEAKAVAFLKSFAGFPPLVLEAERFGGFAQQSEFHTMDLPAIRHWANENWGDGGQFPVANMALTAAHKGHSRLAVKLLRVAFERPGGYALFYLWHPAMAEARKTADFGNLVTDLGFREVWRHSGDWGDFCRPAAGSEITCI